MIFSTKSLIYTAISTVIGLLLFEFISLFGVKGFLVRIIFVGIFAVIGFVIGTCKIPNIDSIKFTKKTSGENIDEIIKRAIKFKLKKNRIYVYAKEEKVDDIK